MKQITLFLFMAFAIIISERLTGQVTIGSKYKPDANAMLDLRENADSTSSKGLLLPRVALSSSTLASPMTAHVKGMTVYNTNSSDDVTPGYYYDDGSKWVRIADASDEPWYSTVTHKGATSNTDSIYTMGKVGIGTSTPKSSAILDIVSSDKGVSLPNVALTGRYDSTTVLSPAEGLIVYNTTYGNAGTPSDSTDDVYSKNLYQYTNSEGWSLLINQDRLESEIGKMHTPELVLLAHYKAPVSALDSVGISFLSADLNSTIRMFKFNEQVYDKYAKFDTLTGEFTAPKTGYYRFSVNTLLAPSFASDASYIRLGICVPYTTTPTTGLSNASFYIINQTSVKTALDVPVNISVRGLVYMTAGQKTIPLTRYVVPSITNATRNYTLNVESLGYKREDTNTMEIIYLPTD